MPTSEGNCLPGGSLTTRGIQPPKHPVVYRNPSARERAEKEDKR